MTTRFAKIFLLLLIVTLILLFFFLGLGKYLTLSYLKEQHETFLAYYAENQWQTIGVFFLVYIIATALSFPGATVMTLAAGGVFGLPLGFLLVSFASTIGATIAFLSARFVLRDVVQKKFSDKLSAINEGVRREGSFYLFSLRLIPIFPFFVINLVMGLTPMTIWRYYWVSQIGMLPGTWVYVNAGTELGEISSLKGILSPDLLFSFALLGLFPFFAKSILKFWKRRLLYKKHQRPQSFDYNLVVIGAGAAGLISAYIAAAVKAKVALIEKHKMGGDCLNAGCVPSKALIQCARQVHAQHRAKEFGLEAISVKFQFSEIMERVQHVIKKIEPHDSIERYNALGVECINGEAKILSPFKVAVNGRVLSTRNIVVAAGASPLVPAFKGLEQIKYDTTETIWNLRTLPPRLLILGGGPIGCELAQAFRRLGSKVILLEKMPRLLLREDEEVSKLVAEKFLQEGIELHLGEEALEFGKEGSSQYLLTKSAAGKQKIIFDRCLLALGRKANVKGYGLEELGIHLRQDQTIEANEFLETNYPNISVCGDVTGPYQFTHTASHMAWYCAVNALFGPFKKFKVDYRVIPWATFIDPEVARVGLNELEAKEKNIPYEISTYPLDDLDRAIAEGEEQGFVKVLTIPGKDRILGCTIVGCHAGELITEFVTAMKWGLGLNKILSTIHIYPTLSEANKALAGRWKQNHKPEKLMPLLAKFHAWRRS